MGRDSTDSSIDTDDKDRGYSFGTSVIRRRADWAGFKINMHCLKIYNATRTFVDERA